MKRNLSVAGHVLVVESDASFRRSLKSCLDKAGYRVVDCATCRESLLNVEANRFDVAIVEYHLPDGNGAKLAQKLRAVQSDLRVLLISFYDLDLIARDVAPVADRFLKKPFDLLEFEATLESLVASPRAAEFSSSYVKKEDIPASLLREGTLCLL